MPNYQYECECGHTVEIIHGINEKPVVLCEKCCKNKMIKLIGCPSVLGTRDSFGFKNRFRDNQSGKTIDNWRSWEKAGYRDPLSMHKGDVKKKIQTKMEKIKN